MAVKVLRKSSKKSRNLFSSIKEDFFLETDDFFKHH